MTDPWAASRENAGTASRRVAALALDAVRFGASLPDALAEAGSEDLLPADRAFARRLAGQVLRQRNRLDARLKPALKRAPKPRWLHDLLILGLAQIEDPEMADHAAVSATVDAAPKPLRGLVNAILRRATRGELPLPELSGVRRDAIEAGMPEWLLLKLRRSWGEQLPAVIAGSNTPPPFGLRVNLQKTTLAEYAAALEEQGLAPQPVGEGGLLLTQAVELARLPGFDEGVVSVQNASAQLAAGLLKVEPQQAVLDACAAPGGKTAHLLECEPSLQMTALDADPERLEDVAEGLQRLGVSARCIATHLQEFEGEEFDRILLDVPCSATGIMRRHPEIRWLRREGDIGRLVAEQKALLAHAWTLLRPGGILLYASCSILLEETEAVVKEFVQAHPGVACDALELPAGEALECGWRIPPGGAWDGFYYARLTKPEVTA